MLTITPFYTIKQPTVLWHHGLRDLCIAISDMNLPHPLLGFTIIILLNKCLNADLGDIYKTSS